MNPDTLTDPREDAQALIARRFLGVSTVVFGLAALLVATGTFPIPHRALLVGCFALAAAFSGFAARRGAPARRRHGPCSASTSALWCWWRSIAR